MKNQSNTYPGEIITQLRLLSVDKKASVVLVGSYARNTQTWRSDMDFFVITPRRINRWKVPLNIHILFDTRKEFIDKLNNGNDFRHWAMRYGKVLVDDTGWWNTIKNNDGIDIWPDWRLKLRHAEKSRSIASQLLFDAAWDNAGEEYLMVASHIARALLLRDKIFPLSRPELPGQLRIIGHEVLSNIIDRLMDGIDQPKDLLNIATSIDLMLKELLLADEDIKSPYAPATLHGAHTKLAKDVSYLL
ncbi:MAG: nucleotidyltransferase domain-containing protein [Nitrospirae bacterium]|nr:nucleotidyltransferase domain-containing protein [Nitrospirota bacterium]